MPSGRGIYKATCKAYTIISIVTYLQLDMLPKPDVEEPCPIARSLAFLGDAWSMLILRDAHAGLTRFDQFRKNLGIAPTILTRRLAALTEEGLLDKRVYSERPPRAEYLLTAAGHDFLPVLVMLGAWGTRHRGGGKLVRFVDAQTGRSIRPVVVDAATQAPLGTRPLKIVRPDGSTLALAPTP